MRNPYTYAQHQADLKKGKSAKQATGVSAKRDAVLSLPLVAYQEYRDRLVEGFLAAGKFLKKQAFYDSRDLPYRTQLVPLACVLVQLGEQWREPKILDRLSQWFWCGVLGELYGGAVESRMANDLHQLMAWVKDGIETPATVVDANFQASRLDSLRTRNSAAYKGINALIQRENAKDWFWKATVHELDKNDERE